MLVERVFRDCGRFPSCNPSPVRAICLSKTVDAIVMPLENTIVLLILADACTGCEIP